MIIEIDQLSPTEFEMMDQWQRCFQRFSDGVNPAFPDDDHLVAAVPFILTIHFLFPSFDVKIHRLSNAINRLNRGSSAIGTISICLVLALNVQFVGMANAQTNRAGRWEITAISSAYVENFDDPIPEQQIYTFKNQVSESAGQGSLFATSYAAQAGSFAYAQTETYINTFNARRGVFSTSSSASHGVGLPNVTIGANGLGGGAIVQWENDFDEGDLHIAYAYQGHEDNGASVSHNGSGSELGVTAITAGHAIGFSQGPIGGSIAHTLRIDGGAGAFSGPGTDDYGASQFAVVWGLGGLPGTTFNDPFMPQPTPQESPITGVFRFSIPVMQDYGVGSMLYFDPVFATGYEYRVDGTRFASVSIPDSLPGGDHQFLLEFEDAFYDVMAGEVFDFTAINALGVSNFFLRGIDLSEMLDPNANPPFVSGLSFTSAGIANVSQTALTSVPEPSSLTLFTLLCLTLVNRRSRR